MITRNVLVTNVWTPVIDADVATFIVSLAGGAASIEYCFTNTENPPAESLRGHLLQDARSITNSTRGDVPDSDLDGGEVSGIVEGSEPSSSSSGTWVWLRSSSQDGVLLVVSS